jgi:uracil-DNA glycosylase family 4
MAEPTSPRSFSPSPRAAAIAQITADVIACRACPRLVAWREEVAAEKRAAFRDEKYWGRAVPGFGDPDAAIVIVGLAPAAHGANRTGRMFTGDRSGDWLYGALYRAGLANQPTSSSRDDGLVLSNAYVTAAVRCAPPANKPTPAERDTCRDYLVREISALDAARVYVALGKFAYDALWPLVRTGASSTRAKFAHLAETRVGDRTVLCSFHPSQQNTFTGRLTEPMLDAVFARALAD